MDEYEMAKAAGVVLDKKSKSHWQFKGAMLVNYYPTKGGNGTVYIAGTKAGVKGVSIDQAIAMTKTAPPMEPANRQRKSWHRIAKRQMFDKSRRCHWCGVEMSLHPLDKNFATIEHIIPLSRGGLDNRNNMTLACITCNQERGNTMSELESCN